MTSMLKKKNKKLEKFTRELKFVGEKKQQIEKLITEKYSIWN